MVKFRKIFFTMAAVLLSVQMFGQSLEPDTARSGAAHRGVYLGVQGGLPFGVSDFSSFAAQGTHVGWSAGVYAGWRFNPVLSLEAVLKWCGVTMAERNCCAGEHFWLGADGVRYNAPVFDMAGCDLSDLKSSVFVQQYGLQLNVNVLGFFNATKQSRWRAEISPLLTAVGTKASIRTLGDNAEMMAGNGNWHLGVGGNVQATYRITDLVNVGVYTGLTYFTGKAIDAVPDRLHKSNYVWESGIRIGFCFGVKANKADKPVKSTETETIEVEVAKVESIEEAKLIEPVVEEAKPIEPVVEEAKPIKPVVEKRAEQAIELPVIYFAINSTRIRHSELPKVIRIRDIMRDNPEMTIVVEGWCDATGDATLSLTFSEWRADAVKRCLESYGIPAGRITVKGVGMDAEASADKGRRAECIIVKIK